MLFFITAGLLKKNTPLSVEKVVFDYDKTEFKIIKWYFFQKKMKFWEPGIVQIYQLLNRGFKIINSEKGMFSNLSPGSGDVHNIVT